MRKRIKLQEYIVTDHASRRDAFLRDVGQWISDGKIRWTNTVVDGLTQMPRAFADLFTGRNTGKMLVRLNTANDDA
ncbi:zinc-binding dehydrogenase [Hephaestia sp. MAHUQ-44]|nr:zinc-binding dehydrogenase [Hephaestia sp. MAHUQ-44]